MIQKYLLLVIIASSISNVLIWSWNIRPQLAHVSTRSKTSLYDAKNSHDPSTQQSRLNGQLSNAARVMSLLAPAFLISQNIHVQRVFAEDISSLTTAPSPTNAANNVPTITHRVFLDIKIANYTEESIGTNKGAVGSGRISFGLYGNDAPESVKRFLKLIQGDGEETPSFVGTQFGRINEENGLLEIEKIRGVETVRIAGQDQWEYRGSILNYEPIKETNQFRHDRYGFNTTL